MRNVVLITVDTLRRDALGCYGNPDGLSPFVDSLAARSLRFTNAQAIGPYTQASFPGILTSSYYLDYPDHGKGRSLSPRRTLISELLSGHGIATAAFHSNAFLCDVFGWNRGWDVFYDGMDVEVTDEVPYVKGDGINREVASWLQRRSGDARRAFLWVHYMDIHEPYVPSRKYVDRVDPSIALDEAGMFGLFRDVLLKRDASSPQTVRLLRKLYDAHVTECDDCVRDLFGILERGGFLEDSAVILTSDHGDEFGEHGGLSHDGRMLPELLNIPLLIGGPGIGAPADCARLVSNVDIPPTIAWLFGVPPAETFSGRSLLPAADYPVKGCFGEAMGKKGRDRETDRPVYYYREDPWRIVHDEASGAWQLFNVAADPGERRDAIAAEPAEAERLKRKLAEHMQRRKG